MDKKARLPWRKLLLPVATMLAFWALAVAMWRSSGYLQALLLFGYIGTAIGLGLGLYAALPKRKKPLGRRLALLLIGSFLMGFVAIAQTENIQIEGFWFGLLTGVTQAAVVHYLIAKILGPMLFGRLWCGWACWTVMVLDLLPYQRSPGRLPGRWGWLRYLHLALSLVLVLVLYTVLGVENGVVGRTAVAWFVAGNLLYYGLGIGLAVALKDNRAFCKYACPVSVPLKLTSRFSLVKVAGDAARCNQCQACVRMCPMDIRIPDYVQRGERVMSTECSLCQTCVSICARDALTLSVGLDMGGVERLQLRGVPMPRTTGGCLVVSGATTEVA